VPWAWSPQGPGHGPTVESWGEKVSYERGTPVRNPPHQTVPTPPAIPLIGQLGTPRASLVPTTTRTPRGVRSLVSEVPLYPKALASHPAEARVSRYTERGPAPPPQPVCQRTCATRHTRTSSHLLPFPSLASWEPPGPRLHHTSPCCGWLVLSIPAVTSLSWPVRLPRT